MPPRAPVALFIFNRPELTARVFEAIAAARPPCLLLVGDGPRPDHPDDAEQVARARAVVGDIDWPCEVKRNYAERNLGCRERLASGLDWVFSEVETAILLEDDTLPDPSFFPFCEELLERFRADERVTMIGGTNLLAPKRLTSDSYLFSRAHTIWGWASWRRAWAYYDREMRSWPELRDTDWLEGLLADPVAAQIAREIFDWTHAGRVPTWDFQWVFSSWRHDGHAILPRVNLVSNIGFGGQASHVRGEQAAFSSLPREAMRFPLRHPSAFTISRAADEAIWRLGYPDRYGVHSRGVRRLARRAGSMARGLRRRR